jgi:hypothetical protein
VTTSAKPTILDFIRALRLSLSPMQAAILASAYALPPTAGMLDLFAAGTGLDPDRWPTEPISILAVIAGRGSGKDSRIACPMALYESLFAADAETIGEQTGTIVLIGQNERSVRGVTLRYLREYIRRTPLLTSQIEKDGMLSGSIRFTNGRMIETLPSTADAPRGFQMPCAILNETGVWRQEGRVDSDREILAAVQPRADKVVIISTPFMQSGVLWDFSKRWGRPEPGVLVWKVSTAAMVPALAAKVHKRRRMMDAELARREFDAEFISGLGAFLTHSMIDACVDKRVHEREPRRRGIYHAAIDMSGGRHDRSALAIVETSGDRIWQCLLRVWDSKTSREGVIAQAAAELRRYGLRAIAGDNYAANFLPEGFDRHGIRYISTGERKGHRRLTRSDAYAELEPLIRAQRIALLDDEQQTRELLGLVRRDQPGGRFTINHVSGEHDDRANALAVAAAMAERARVREVRDARRDEEDYRPVGRFDPELAASIDAAQSEWRKLTGDEAMIPALFADLALDDDTDEPAAGVALATLKEQLALLRPESWRDRIERARADW